MKKTVLLPYDPKTTTPDDLKRLRSYLNKRAPEVRLVGFPATRPPVCLAEITGPRTITVTMDHTKPSPIFEHVPGTKFFSRRRSKLRLFEDLAHTGIPVPVSERLSLDLEPTEARYGPYITIKSMAPGTSRAKGIVVLKTTDYDRLRDRIFYAYQADISKGYTPLVQQYIPTGPRPKHTVVSTFLGAPIVCFETIARRRFDPERMSGLVGGDATSNARDDRTRKLVSGEKKVALAKRVAQAFPETAVLSIDMVHCQDTGKLYCLETNIGNLCVLSASRCSQLRKALGAKNVYKQFGSYDTMAKQIIETLEDIPGG